MKYAAVLILFSLAILFFLSFLLQSKLINPSHQYLNQIINPVTISLVVIGFLLMVYVVFKVPISKGFRDYRNGEYADYNKHKNAFWRSGYWRWYVAGFEIAQIYYYLRHKHSEGKRK